MENKLTVREFKKMCDDISPQKFIFSSENQSRNMFESSAMKLTFKIMLIAFTPNTICFKSDDGFLRLDRVKKIKVLDRNSMLGIVFTIVCGDSKDDFDIEYTFIAR